MLEKEGLLLVYYLDEALAYSLLAMRHLQARELNVFDGQLDDL